MRRGLPRLVNQRQRGGAEVGLAASQKKFARGDAEPIIILSPQARPLEWKLRTRVYKKGRMLMWRSVKQPRDPLGPSQVALSSPLSFPLSSPLSSVLFSHLSSLFLSPPSLLTSPLSSPLSSSFTSFPHLFPHLSSLSSLLPSSPPLTSLSSHFSPLFHLCF